MVDLQSILAGHRSKSSHKELHDKGGDEANQLKASLSEIPDLFFDRIVVDYKLSRIEILVLMYIYRRVWCYPNLHRDYGISPMMSHTEMAKVLALPIEDVYSALRKLEEQEFIKTIRAGQYFVRRYFSRKNDEELGQNYSDFDV